MKSDYVIYGALIVVVVILGYTLRDFSAGPAENIQENRLLTKTTGSTEPGDVQIDLTPKRIANGRLAVGFAANTHSVSMDNLDLMKITTLSYGGKDYAPVSAPKLSGHHNFGDIIFDLNEMPRNFKITIKGIPGEQERVFEWNG